VRPTAAGVLDYLASLETADPKEGR
jgi:hypothetical protein